MDSNINFFTENEFNELLEKALNKLSEWTEGEIKDWDISRDEPYFGFKIPEYSDKYFYVLLYKKTYKF